MLDTVLEMVRENARYAKYLARHKWFVGIECLRLGIPWRAITHDLSKLELHEWMPYVDYFYGTKVLGPTAFDEAWLAHQRCNCHHWQCHVVIMDDGSMRGLPMELDDIKEMLADWRGMSAMRGIGSIAKWYVEHEPLMELHWSTKARLTALFTDQEREEIARLIEGGTLS